MYFIENNDIPQLLYEKHRSASIDRRFKMEKQIVTTMRSHGVAGLFIDPENVLCPLSPIQARTSPRHCTAFHCSHLAEDVFATIAKSLAEGVGVAATARIQDVDKKTVLHVLAKAGDHAMQVNRCFLNPTLQESNTKYCNNSMLRSCWVSLWHYLFCFA